MDFFGICTFDVSVIFCSLLLLPVEAGKSPLFLIFILFFVLVFCLLNLCLCAVVFTIDSALLYFFLLLGSTSTEITHSVLERVLCYCTTVSADVEVLTLILV